VETHAQLNELRAIGCTQAQGNLFSPPRPLNEFSHLLVQARPVAKIA
jgi:EAL domain-containing protein (putative c-di-GMP-specific phosphodiesterase class I)